MALKQNRNQRSIRADRDRILRVANHALNTSDWMELSGAFRDGWRLGDDETRKELLKIYRQIPDARKLGPAWGIDSKGRLRFIDVPRKRYETQIPATKAQRAAARSARMQRPHVHGTRCMKAWTPDAEMFQVPTRRHG